MADPRFFINAGPFTLAELADIAEARCVPGQETCFRDVAALDQAGPTDVSFLDNRKYVELFRTSKAGAFIVHADFASQAPAGAALLLAPDPYRSYARVAEAFYPAQGGEGASGIAAGASVDPSAVLGEGCRVDTGAVIGARAEIGAGCWIGANAVIGTGVVLGERCTIGANATLQMALLGKRVTVYPGARIGQDGFGFAMGPKGHLKVPQLGRVIIEDDVEVGANSTIDRGAGPDTIIGAGSVIDNLVQIGHNVQIGKGCVIVAQVGISGSTKLGDFVVVGGQVGFAGHLKIGSGVRIAAQSGLMRDVAPGETVGGSPAVPHTEWMRQLATVSKLSRRKK